MRTAALLTVLLMGAVGLAGCAEDGDGPAPPPVTAVKGAIKGLLVDDRFRPIELVETAKTEFQAEGFILLQETGAQVRSNENGEFEFGNLDPGEYTLRVTASGHEAKPRKTAVVANEFTEIDLEARRVASDLSFFVQEAHSAFQSCTIHFVVYSYNGDCLFDGSGDSSRFDFFPDLRVYGNVSWAVAEALFMNEPKGGEAVDVVIRRTLGHDYTSGVLFPGEGTYMKLHLENGSVSPDPVPFGGEHQPWNNTEAAQFALFGRGHFGDDIGGVWAPAHEVLKDTPCAGAAGLCPNHSTMRRGLGISLGLQANFLITAFIDEPLHDPLQFCGLCESPII